jgi:hypothetical protein
MPINASSFLREWEQMLDPLRAARRAAQDFLGAEEDWRVGDWFAEPTFASAALLRTVAQDEKVVELFENTVALLVRGDRELSLSGLVVPDEGLKEEALPVLLGVAVSTALHEIGLAGRWFSERVAADKNRRDEVRLAAWERVHQRRQNPTESAEAERRRAEAVLDAKRRLQKPPRPDL